jgi:hypothetical protein
MVIFKPDSSENTFTKAALVALSVKDCSEWRGYSTDEKHAFIFKINSLHFLT